MTGKSPDTGWIRRHGLTLTAVVFGVVVGAGVFLSLEHRETRLVEIEAVQPLSAAETAAGERRPDFTLPDVDGVLRDVSQWDGRLLVINFWATWCAPCRHEIPFFVELQTLYGARGLQFVGIAIDDPTMIEAFVEEVGMNYPCLHGQLNAMEVSKQYGNRVGGLPFTVVVDRSGNIVARKNGPFERDEIESLLVRYL